MMISFPQLGIEHETLSFLLVGVGGQGTILASNVLAELGIALGYDVKKAEVHGMSQRGGSVISHLRWGSQVHSPIISKGEADIIVAFEKLEALRFVDQIRPDGVILVNDYEIVPVTVSSGAALYPDDESIRGSIKTFTDRNYWVKGVEIAEALGNVKVSNVVVLGALSALMGMDQEKWLSVISSRVPVKYLELNRIAFQQGRDAIRVQDYS
ncbi:MAG TPA: indolepyruvate oxidoreductase subunit beta [Anaerovoracaceae bacterium]|nr:indolepyruvate oxidoreductase subunit beta [Anaerovoracaceae bacterium]